MNPGSLSIVFSFLCSVVAAVLFFRGRRAPPDSALPKRLLRSGASSVFFLAATCGGSIASVLLLVNLLTHQFQYAYVARYSSLDQPVLYLVSAFWAGQEGTFLLWALLVAAMGVVFQRTTKEPDLFAMGTVSAFMAFLFLLMSVKSPFETTAAVPPDGSGMNPLLQDPWMAIHPPVLFAGYAATLFPFALALSALARRKMVNWSALGFPWTLVAAVALGAGIIIGGFWAYEVLGWGGYWGWDPVENSSLVPWLTLLALIHGLVAQKAKGSLVRTNIALALLSFLLVLYATFLTRSGVLADFSVHSFVDLGINNYLVSILVAATAIAASLFGLRFRGIRSPRIDAGSVNREPALLLGLFVLCAGAAFTLVGMSSPMLTGLFGKASQVEPSFYNKVNLPVAVGIALLLGVTPFLGWTGEGAQSILKRLSLPLLLTALSLAIAGVAGVASFSLLLLVGSAAFALVSNIVVSFRQYRSGWTALGGPAAHIGVALLLIGIVGSGSFDETVRLRLRQGEPQNAYGYAFLFRGVSQSGEKKQSVDLEVKDGRSSFTASPRLYFSEYNQAMMREPDIKIFPLKDLYISPLEITSSAASHGHNPVLELAKGETKEIGGYKVSFVRFEMGSAHDQAGSMSVGAVLNVGAQGNFHEVVPQMRIEPDGKRTLVPVDMPSLHFPTKGLSAPRIALNAISVEEKRILLELLGGSGVPDAAPAQELLVEISSKPLMMVVWSGVVLIVAGSALSLRRRAAEAP